jgi:methionyl-tRNA formyltransferase
VSAGTLKIVFVGALIGGHKTLTAVLEHGFHVARVYTWSDARQGASCWRSFDDLPARYGVEVRKVDSINAPEVVADIRALAPDVIVVMSWSGMIGKELLAVPRLGVIGMHPTLLPENRGRAPIPWALIHGLEKTGVSLFYYVEAADAGDLLAQDEIPITEEDTALTLGLKVDDACVRCTLRVLAGLEDGTVTRTPQDHSRATFWPRRRPEDGVIDWSKPARDLYNWVRGLTRPYPGAFTFFGGRKVFVWSAAVAHGNNGVAPGTVVGVTDAALLVATGDGMLALTTLQAEGGDDLTGARFVATIGARVGDRFGDGSC